MLIRSKTRRLKLALTVFSSWGLKKDHCLDFHLRVGCACKVRYGALRLFSGGFAIKIIKRTFLPFCSLIAVSLFLSIAAQGQKKIESTDPVQRLKWYDQHAAMKDQTPFKDLKWRYIPNDNIS